MLAGAWVTSYTFSQPPKLHVDIAHITVERNRQVRARNFPPEPRTEGHRVAYRNEIDAQLANRHLIGCWKNSSDASYFGALHLAVLPGEAVMEGHYSGYASDVEVSIGPWKWVRLDPASLPEVPVEDPTILLNIDTPDDLKKLHAKIIQAAKRKDETLRRQFRHAQAQAFPAGQPQEREQRGSPGVGRALRIAPVRGGLQFGRIGQRGGGHTVDQALSTHGVQPDAFYAEWRRRVGIK